MGIIPAAKLEEQFIPHICGKQQNFGLPDMLKERKRSMVESNIRKTKFHEEGEHAAICYYVQTDSGAGSGHRHANRKR